MSQRKYKFELRKSSKKDRCPSCGQYKVFVPYISVATGEPAGPLFGRCERINSCKYNKYPNNSYDVVTVPIQYNTVPVIERDPDFVNDDIVLNTLKAYRHNAFFSGVRNIIGCEAIAALSLMFKYNIGTAQFRGTIFWQQDKEGKYRTGKVMYYNPLTCKRDKDRNSWYVHKQIDSDFSLKQVFFGEHLITRYADMPVALCESEKTAVVMSVLEPKYIWLATGGSEMINPYRLSRLHRLDKIFPDNGQAEKWIRKTTLFNPEVDTSVDNAVLNGTLKPGSDILDLYLQDGKYTAKTL